MPTGPEPKFLHMGLERAIDYVVKNNSVALRRQRGNLGVGLLCEGLASCERSAFNILDPNLVSVAQVIRFEPYGGAAATEKFTIYGAGGAW